MFLHPNNTLNHDLSIDPNFQKVNPTGQLRKIQLTGKGLPAQQGSGSRIKFQLSGIF